MTNKSIKYSLNLIVGSIILLTMTQAAYTFQSSMRTRRSSAHHMIQAKLHAVPPGSFGGTGIIAIVEKDGVKIEFDCADGVITKQLKVDKKGFFKILGLHKGPNVGPARQTDASKSQPVYFEGQITGNVMKLKVTVIKTNEVIGEFTLRRDARPFMQRCA